MGKTGWRDTSRKNLSRVVVAEHSTARNSEAFILKLIREKVAIAVSPSGEHSLCFLQKDDAWSVRNSLVSNRPHTLINEKDDPIELGVGRTRLYQVKITADYVDELIAEHRFPPARRYVKKDIVNNEEHRRDVRESLIRLQHQAARY